MMNGRNSFIAWLSTIGNAAPGSVTGRSLTSRILARVVGVRTFLRRRITGGTTRRPWPRSCAPIPTPPSAAPRRRTTNPPNLPHCPNFSRKRKVPSPFVSWHTYHSDPIKIRATIDGVKALLKEYPSLNPETILNEWNMSLSNPSLDPRFQPCFIAEVAWLMKESGLDYSCYYHIRDYHVQ